MSAPAGETFPSPVGGAPFSNDIAPSILFVVLYGLLGPFILYRVLGRTSRTTILIGPMIFGFERVADFTLRYLEASNGKDRTSVFLVTWMQTTYGAGFITIGHTLVALLRCILVQAEKNAELPDRAAVNEVDLEAVQPLTGGAEGGSGFQSSSTSILPEKKEKWPRIRIIKTVGLVVSLNYFAATMLSAVGGSIYYGAIESPKIAKLVQELRYLDTIIPFVFLQATNMMALYTLKTKPQVPRKPLLFISGLAFLLSIIGIYRLIVMRCQTTALESMAACSLNSDGSKATFYTFHILPELIAIILILSVNVRQMFGTGPFGHGERVKSP